MKLLIRFFWAVSVASCIVVPFLFFLRSISALRLTVFQCLVPASVPGVVMVIICFVLGLFDLLNFTIRAVRRSDRQRRWESRPPRYIRRRKVR